MRTLFAALAKEEASIEPEFVAFLGRAYTLKERTDYGIGAQPEITDAEAEEMIDRAQRLIDRIEGILS